MKWPGRDPSYDHTVAVCQQNQARLQLAQAYKPEYLFVSDIWAISDVRLWQTNKLNQYEIHIRNGVFAFYYPYARQEPIELSTSGRYTLVTTYPDHTYNWVVCESLGKRNEKCRTPDGVVKMAEIELLRKLGVLKTDSSSEFVLRTRRTDSILEKINALFV